MSQSDFFLVGLILSFLLTFILSFLHVVFSSYSRIGFSRILEENSPLKEEILDHYDQLKIAIDYGRVAFLLAFVIYTCLVFPGLSGWPFWAFLLFLALYLLFYDYLPRLLLLALGEKNLKFFLPVLMPVKFLLYPLLLLPRFFLKKEEERQAAWRTHETTEEEIETFIDEATEEGIIEKDQNELLRGVVEFGDQMVREIMTPRSRMVAVEITTSLGQLKEVFVREKYSRIPVYRERLDNIQGVVMAKDLLEFSDQQQAGRRIDFLVRPVIFVPETMAVKRLLKEFKKVKQKLAIVIDEYGGVSGLVTMEDLLEEIVGEIQDEYDIEEPQIVAEKPDTYLVQGETEVEELEELLGSELSEENLLTVNGLLQQHLGRLPRPGEKLELAGLSFEILEVDDKSIRKVRLTRKRDDNQTEKEG